MPVQRPDHHSNGKALANERSLKTVSYRRAFGPQSLHPICIMSKQSSRVYYHRFVAACLVHFHSKCLVYDVIRFLSEERELQIVLISFSCRELVLCSRQARLANDL